MRAADLMRQRIAAGFAIGDGADALDLVVGTMVGGLGAQIHALSADIQTAEDEFLNERLSPATRDLVAVRRRGARLHRLVAGMRAALARLERDPDLPALLAPVAERHVQRLPCACPAQAKQATAKAMTDADLCNMQAPSFRRSAANPSIRGADSRRSGPIPRCNDAFATTLMEIRGCCPPVAFGHCQKFRYQRGSGQCGRSPMALIAPGISKTVSFIS
jgi:hypothetical protein